MSGRLLITTRRSADYASSAFLDLLDDVCLASLLQLGPIDVTKIDKDAFTPDGWTRFSEALLRLNSHNRIIRCPDLSGGCPHQTASICPLELNVATVVVGHAPGQAVPLSAYLGHPSRVGIREQDLSYRAPITEAQFSAMVFDQFFHYARELKFVDRALGQYWSSNVIYQRTLEWFVQQAKMRGVRDIALVTAFHHNSLANEPLVHLECDRLGIALESKGYAGFPHWRAIISDRFTVIIDHGLDLRLGTGRVRETEMHVKGLNDVSMQLIKGLRPAGRNPHCSVC